MTHRDRSTARRRSAAIAAGGKRTRYVKTRTRNRDRRARPLADHDLFLGLPEEDSRKVIRWMEEKRFPRGAAIFRRNDPCDSLYVLMEGVVKLVAGPGKGAGTILHVLRPADVFGELLLAEANRPFDALAVTDVLAGVLSRNHLVDLLSSVPGFRMNFIRILSDRLVHVEKGVTEFSHTRSYQRLAGILLRMCREYGEDTSEGVVLRLPLTHLELAGMIGTTRETVTNQLHRFRRLGLVGFRGRSIIVNRRRLAGFVRSGEIPEDAEGVDLEKSA